MPIEVIHQMNYQNRNKKYDKNELEHIKDMYDLSRIYVKEDVDVNLIVSIIRNAFHFERPDIVSIVNGKLYAIEHFEIDSYKRNRKGSKLEQESGRFIRNTKNKLIDESNKSIISGKHQYNIDGDLINYKNNFIYMFNEHISNIEEYKKRIFEKLGINEFELWFFVEDVNPFGIYVNDIRYNGLISPLNIHEIHNILKCENRINGIIVGSFDGEKDRITIVPKDYYQNHFDEEYIDLDCKIESHFMETLSYFKIDKD